MRIPKQIFAISLILFLVSTVFVSFNSHNAYACSYRQPSLSLDEEISRYDTIFSGKVIENQDRSATQQRGLTFFTFDVDNVWKGERTDTIIVRTAEPPASCGFPFEENQEYIVYGAQNNGYNNDHVLVYSFSRTGLLSEASEDLQKLGSGYSIEVELLSPLKQLKSGVPINEIQCKDDLQIVTRHNDAPACIKPNSIQKLEERGWINTVDVYALLKETYTIGPLQMYYAIINANISEIIHNVDAQSITISLQDVTSNGEVTITLPNEFLDAVVPDGKYDGFFVLVDGEEVNYNEVKTTNDITLTIMFEKDSRLIEIIVTNLI